MKYAQLIMGLLIGTAIGGAGVAATIEPTGGADEATIKKIVRETISEEPKLILDSVNKFQQDQQKQQLSGANDLIKDPATRAEIFDSKDAPFIGPADAEKVVVEFFDYNCPACKMMFEGLDKLATADKSVKIIFKEYPIFGPQSDTNSKIAIAIHRLDDSKYYAFHQKMMAFKGKADEKAALDIVKAIGMNPAKVKAESEKPEVSDILNKEKALGQKMKIAGTPTLIVNDELVPHAMSYDDLQARLNAPTAQPVPVPQPQ